MAWTARHCFPFLEAVELWKPQAATSHTFDSTRSHKETKIHIMFSCSRGNGECSWGHPRSCHQRYVTYRRPSACLKEEMTLILPHAWIKVLLHLRVGLPLYVIVKRVSRELDGPWRLLKANTLKRRRQVGLQSISPKGKLLGSWLRISGSLGYLQFEWLTQSGRVHWKIKC